ncbi:MAG: cytochrome c oxidase accessory protein CcoG [Opitutaceae bacterium]
MAGILSPKPTRDSVTTIAADGSRIFLHPSEVKGRFVLARRIVAYALIVFYLALPWIPINGAPAVFLDIGGRRFHLFGATLAFQDAWLLFFVITGLAFTLFYVTALLGRVWCGWACPQTVFMEHVFRRIEYWIEGDAVSRRALDQEGWGPGKLAKRVAKHVAFFVVSAGVTHLFLSYFVSLPELWHMMRSAPGEHWGAFLFVFLASAVLYFNFAWFREQMCIVICPYGRMQSALLDDHSLVVAYDAQRGEPRGKAGTPDAGACIDCRRCVQVCPTGIDIRQGLQIECVACTACIDACDEVMDRVHRPRGLVRYTSQVALVGKKTRWFRPRTVLYTVLLAAGASVATWALSTVRPASMSITRMIGAPYFVNDDGVRNQFMLRLINKQAEPVRFVVAVENLPAGVQRTGFDQPVEIPALGEILQPLVLQQSRADYTGNFAFAVRVRDERGTFTLGKEAEFLGPDAELLRADTADKSGKARP